MITVDAFCHLGDCCVYETSVSDYELMSALDANKVGAAIVQPFPGPPNPAEVHDRIAALGSKHPGRVFGVANANPHVDRDRYHREIERCVRELGFVGVALDTFGHAVNPAGRDAQTVFEAARELGIPVVVHTGWGLPFGLPSTLLGRAREYSDVKIVIARAGAGLFTAEAYVVARECPNVYVETSWCRGIDAKWLVNEVGASRVLLGSDVPANLEAELAKYRSIGLYQFQQYQVLGQNAIDVFGLKGVTEYVEPAAVVETTTVVEAPPTEQPEGSQDAAATTESPESAEEPAKPIELTEKQDGATAAEPTKPTGTVPAETSR